VRVTRRRSNEVPHGGGSLRAAATLAVVTAAFACASAGAVPGGPVDHSPPQISTITPDSGQVNVHPKRVDFRFDETVNDRPSGASTLDQLFLISPRSGDVDVSWHRSRISVQPSKGFRPNTAYRITMLPGLADLRGNVRRDGLTVLFSTGPTFPPFNILGHVFDWAAQRAAVGAYVEAIAHPDTSVVYLGATDSTGQFEVGPLPAGSYTLRAIIDVNHNRTLDRDEKWDSATVAVASASPTLELDAIERDTIPAAIADVRVDDSVTIRVAFDKPLDPTLPLQPALFTIQRKDSSTLEVTKVQWASGYDRARQAAIEDSIRKADTSAARRPPPPPPAAVPVPGGARQPPAAVKPRAPAPERAVVLSLNPKTPLKIDSTYRITARGVRNLLLRSREVTRTFTMPKPPPRDTTHRAPADTVRRRPPR